MATRPPSDPPHIPGFTYERLLGSGGFADVFLYSQDLPRRQVAVKVLLAPTTDAASRAQFVAEANVMAQLSAHPSIVTIYHADTAGDGRPYLVMEYCPRPNLSVRYRTAPLGVAESVRIGIRLAGAVETAHRAGILHRDIKPANVLTTDYGWPALTDFGISVVQHSAQEAEAVGMSIPWSAPEFFDERAPRGVGADIYALTATVYTLLAGRSPFERGSGQNSALEMISRIEHEPLPPLPRDDVPDSLQETLRRGMAKKPEHRFGSAAEFARTLQRIEQELQLAQTSLDLPDTSWIHVPDAVGEDLRTRVRSVVEITPTTTTGDTNTGASAPALAGESAGAAAANLDGHRGGLPGQPGVAAAPTRVRAPEIVPSAGAAHSAATPPAAAPHSGNSPAAQAVAEHGASPGNVDPQSEAAPPQRRRGRWLTLAASLAVIGVVAGVVIYGAVNAPEDQPEQAGPTMLPQPSAPAASRPDPPIGLTGERDNADPATITFTWQAPDYDGELEYAWRQVPATGEQTERTSATDITLTDHPERVCIEVAAISSQFNRLSEWSEACA